MEVACANTKHTFPLLPFSSLPFFFCFHPSASLFLSYVDWHGDPTNLPADIVSRFANKTIAITGYEVNIVRNNSLGKEEEVPAYELYNHHYSGSMSGAAVEMVCVYGVTACIFAEKKRRMLSKQLAK